MVLKKRITISWSGGKDSALAMYRLLQTKEYEVSSIHTVVNAENKRVGLHGVREEMIKAQAEALGIPLVIAYLEPSDEHDRYEQLVRSLYAAFVKQGVTHVLFGDIFLEDLKQYREKLLAESGLSPVYPLWQLSSEDLIKEFCMAGFKTVLCSVNETCFKAGLLGKVIDDSFIADLPSDVDACGENGEFHTFVFDGPIFTHPVNFQAGEQVSKGYKFAVVENDSLIEKSAIFYFQDILP